MAKFPEAEARILQNMFVCRKCKSKIRTSNMKVLTGKVECRNCDSTQFKPLRRK